MLKKWIKRMFLLVLAVAVVVAGSLALAGYLMYRDALETVSVEDMAAQIRDRDSFIPLDELPVFYREAVVSVEDRNFYDHRGIDVTAIVRAAYYDIMTMSMAQGGSTITQQLAKNSYFTQDKQLQRKAAEVFMAFAIEDALTKDDILELYVNSIYFGANCYSVGAASAVYFDKQPAELSEAECVLLAALPHAPSVYSVKPEPLLQRAEQVLACMVLDGHITQEESAALMTACTEAAEVFDVR